MEQIKILIADDNESIRNGIRSLLETQQTFNVVGEAVDGVDAVLKTEELRPDIVLMDIEMPKMNGLEAAKIILNKFLNNGILMLTVHEDDEFIISSYNIGVRGYILKNAPAEELFNAIRMISKGEKYFRPTILNILKERQNISAEDTKEPQNI